MALQLGATRAAFLAANVPEDKASAAAEELAGYDNQFAEIRSDLRVLKWQVALLFAVTGPTLVLLLRVAAKVGAFG